MDVMRMFLMKNGNFDENGRKSFEEVETQDGAVTLAAAREVRLLYIVLVVCFLFTPCYKQFLPGLEEPEKSADAEKSEILR